MDEFNSGGGLARAQGFGSGGGEAYGGAPVYMYGNMGGYQPSRGYTGMNGEGSLAPNFDTPQYAQNGFGQYAPNLDPNQAMDPSLGGEAARLHQEMFRQQIERQIASLPKDSPYLAELHQELAWGGNPMKEVIGAHTNSAGQVLDPGNFGNSFGAFSSAAQHGGFQLSPQMAAFIQKRDKYQQALQATGLSYGATSGNGATSFGGGDGGADAFGGSAGIDATEHLRQQKAFDLGKMTAPGGLFGDSNTSSLPGSGAGQHANISTYGWPNAVGAQLANDNVGWGDAFSPDGGHGFNPYYGGYGQTAADNRGDNRPFWAPGTLEPPGLGQGFGSGDNLSGTDATLQGMAGRGGVTSGNPMNGSAYLPPWAQNSMPGSPIAPAYAQNTIVGSPQGANLTTASSPIGDVFDQANTSWGGKKDNRFAPYVPQSNIDNSGITEGIVNAGLGYGNQMSKMMNNFAPAAVAGGMNARPAEQPTNGWGPSSQAAVNAPDRWKYPTGGWDGKGIPDSIAAGGQAFGQKILGDATPTQTPFGRR